MELCEGVLAAAMVTPSVMAAGGAGAEDESREEDDGDDEDDAGDDADPGGNGIQPRATRRLLADDGRSARRCGVDGGGGGFR